MLCHFILLTNFVVRSISISVAVYRTEYGSDWPLGDREIKIIDRNFDKLSTSLLTSHGFFEKMLSNGIINYEQMEFLKNETKHSFKHCEDFLSILRRFSRRSFSSTLECLRELKQDHVASMLEEGDGRFYKEQQI